MLSNKYFVFIFVIPSLSIVKIPACPNNGMDEIIAMFSFSGVSTLIDVKVPSHLTMGEYGLKVEGTGGLTFSNWTKLDFEKKSSSILVQTDRAMYKPGQTGYYTSLCSFSLHYIYGNSTHDTSFHIS